MPRSRTHPLLAYMNAQKPPLSYRKAADELDCHFTTLHQICAYGSRPLPGLAKRIVKWTGGKVGWEELFK